MKGRKEQKENTYHPLSTWADRSMPNGFIVLLVGKALCVCICSDQ